MIDRNKKDYSKESIASIMEDIVDTMDFAIKEWHNNSEVVNASAWRRVRVALDDICKIKTILRKKMVAGEHKAAGYRVENKEVDHENIIHSA